jgi:S-adenosylmethionine:tRNA ribosyltransferase-isomerase
VVNLQDLQYPFPDELIATEPKRPARVMFCSEDQNYSPQELSLKEFLHEIPAGDLLVVNDTQVLKRRIFAGDLEILFLQDLGDRRWEVLFPAKKMQIGDEISLPQGLKVRLISKGRPQIIEASMDLHEKYFAEVAELPLPPYIQKARGQRRPINGDENWYQTAWASQPGSLAAPTAGLHFNAGEVDLLKARGVQVLKVTLHVGLGTFLPVLTEDLREHKMHEEQVEISNEVWTQICQAKESGRGVWALGTTVARALESAPLKLLKKNSDGDFFGATNLKIMPGFQWQVVDCLATNFHQPESTLLALVAGFAGLENVKKNYQWAIERRFRLFSYGDLTVWKKS